MPIIIIISRMLSRILNAFGFGATTMIGKIALRLKPTILYYLSKGVKVVCVTGTNGKTTTCAMIEKGMIENNKTCFVNKSGANMLGGIVTAFINNSTLSGKCKKEYAILECDENSLPLISSYLDSACIVVTNIFRDQLDRYTEVTTTFKKIVKGIHNSKNAVVVLNADCPVTWSISNFCKNNIVSFGMSMSSNIDAPKDNVFCPVCNGMLFYRKNIFAHLGDYYCKCCDYGRITPNFNATNIREKNGLYSFDLLSKGYDLQIGGIYNVYNFLSACCVLSYFGMDYSSVANFGGSFGRLETFYNNNQKIVLMLVKNPVGFANCIDYANSIDGQFDVAFALNDNDADGRDVSWIWDVKFKPLVYKAVDYYTFGKRSYDMCLRLKYDEIIAKPFQEDYENLISVIKKSKNNFVIFASYTAMMDMRHFLIKEFGGEEFWQ